MTTTTTARDHANAEQRHGWCRLRTGDRLASSCWSRRRHIRALVTQFAAHRRRLPMTEVDATLEVIGSNGPTSVLDMFEGRRQLIVYHHMLKPDDEHPCPGCSAFTDHVPHLAHLHVADVTFAMEAAAPLDQFRAYMARMGRPDIAVYSSAGGQFRDELHPSPHGTGSFD